MKKKIDKKRLMNCMENFTKNKRLGISPVQEMT